MIYTGCKRPRACRGPNYLVKAITHNLEGLDLDNADDGKDDDKDDHKNKDNKDSAQAINDLSKALQVLTVLFPEEKRPTGDENEAFTSRLTPILQHIETLNIQKNQRPSVLLTLLSVPTRKA